MFLVWQYSNEKLKRNQELNDVFLIYKNYNNSLTDH